MDSCKYLFGLCMIATLICLSSAEAQSQRLYQWTDDKGVLHVTDSVQNVPEKYRPQTKQVGQASADESGAGTSSSQGRAGGNSAATTAGNEDQQKTMWQQRMIDARLKLRMAEEKAQQLEQRKSELQSRWGSAGAALPPQEAIDEMKQVNAELSSVQREVEQARNVVNNVIPDEARRAGIPPGWLREVE